MSDRTLSRVALCGALAFCLTGSGKALGVVIELTSYYFDTDKYHLASEPNGGPSWLRNYGDAANGPTHDPGEPVSETIEWVELPDRSDWMASAANLVLYKMGTSAQYDSWAYTDGITGSFEDPWEATSALATYTFDDAGFPHYCLESEGIGWAAMAKDSTKFPWTDPVKYIVTLLQEGQPASVGIWDDLGAGRILTVCGIDTDREILTVADPNEDRDGEVETDYSYTISTPQDISVSYAGTQQDLRYVCSFDEVTWWTGASGTWGTAENWVWSRLPTSQQGVYLSPDSVATVTVDADAQAHSLDIASNATLRVTAGTLELRYGGIRCDGAIEVDPGTGLLTYVHTIIGHTGTGTLIQTGGQVDVARLTLGSEAGSEGFYHLSGSAELTVGKDVFEGNVTIGSFGTGTLIQTGATLTVCGMGSGDGGGRMFLGAQEGSRGTYSISGGTLDLRSLMVGNNVADGTFEIASPACNIAVGTRLAFGRHGSLVAVPGTTIQMTGGDLVNESLDPAALAGLANSTLIFTYRRGGGDFEVAGKDMGPVEAGYADNFALNTLQVGTETKAGGVKLYDKVDNQWAAAAIEALYADRVLIQHASVLQVNGLSLYAREVSVDPESQVDLQAGALAVAGDVEAMLDGWVGTRVVDSLLSPLMQLDAVYDPGVGWTSVLAVPAPGAETRWQHDPATPGSWFEPANWTNGVPDASHVNVIDNGGTAQMTGGNRTSGAVHVPGS